MPRRSFNPNTKYGRRQIRKQAPYNISQYTPEQKSEYKKFEGTTYLVIFIIIIVLFIIAAATGNEKGFIKWLR